MVRRSKSIGKMVQLFDVSIRLGVKTRAFHLGDYRRAHMGAGVDVPHDYFFVKGERNLLSGVLLLVRDYPHIQSKDTAWMHLRASEMQDRHM